MKRQLKRLAALTAGRWFARPGAPRVVVLCYHSIDPGKWFASASPALFERHLEWLKEHCEVIPFRNAAQAAAEDLSGRPRVAITFDDGYADNFDYAFPLLHKHGLSATFFTTVGLLDKDPAVVGRFQRLRNTGFGDIRPMEWAQAREMLAAGQEFGAHTYSHPNLAQIGEADTRLELIDARRMMEDRLDHDVRTFAYPFGKPRRHFSALTTGVAREAGYKAAAAVLFRGVSRNDSSLVLPRFFVQRDTTQLLGEKIGGLWDVIGCWQEYAPSWVNRLVSAADFERSKASATLMTPHLQSR
jgi:peptidoglycan/xylan/chitin deacetylase (PgdA/CDA1 family)